MNATRVWAVKQWSTQLCLGLLVASGLAIGSSQVAAAQTANTNPLQDFQNSDASDPFSSRGSGQVSGMMNWLQRAMQNNDQNWADFNAAQDENLEQAAAAFREAQRKRMNSTPQPDATQPTPVTPAPAPSTPN